MMDKTPLATSFKEMINTLLPDLVEQENFFASFQQPLKKSISINRHRDKNFENKYSDFQLSQTVFDLKDTYYIDRDDRAIALGKTRQHLTGSFYIQEVAASLPAAILKDYLVDLSHNKSHALQVLDIAAAPGGKTTQLADYLLANEISGVVRGNDIDDKRLKTRSLNIQRCGLYNTVLTKLDGTRFGQVYSEYFDGILVDAPCSGEGTGFKSDAAFKWRKEESINKIVGLQSQILDSALHACKVDGIVVYSTCTLNVFENEQQITRILERYGDALEILPINLNNKSPGIVTDPSLASGEEIKMLRAWPHIHQTGGFFVCVIRKKRSLHRTDDTLSLPLRKFPFEYDKGLERSILKSLSEIYGISIDTQKFALVRGRHGSVYLAEAHVRQLLKEGVWLQECGIPFLKQTGSSYSPEHGLGLVFASSAHQYTLELSTQELQEYAEGKDIEISSERLPLSSSSSAKVFNNYLLLTHQQQGVGVGKVVQGVLKNKFLKR